MFVHVVLPTALPDALTYAVPDELEGLAVVGARVRVKLRGSSRIGLVVACVDQTDVPSDKLLAIDEVLDVEPLLPAYILDLIAFAADYYFANIGNVLRMAVPASLLALPPDIVELGHRGVELLTTAQGQEKALLERLITARRITVSRLIAEGWDRRQLLQFLERLTAQHGVRVTERSPRPGGATVSAVMMAEMDDERQVQLTAGAPAQKRALAWLKDTTGPAIVSTLKKEAKVSDAVVLELVRKGVLKRFQQSRVTPLGRFELPAGAVPKTLSSAQKSALAALFDASQAALFAPFLLLGVTGSGKTEVYLRLAEEMVRQGKQSLILVPEIGLTPALAGQLRGRFGDRVAMVHSSMSDGERFRAWDRARRGEVDVVAGPRSALWAPLPQLGAIVIDEEQDPSYKQEEEPRYQARDLALWLGNRLRIPVVLASATPSLEALDLIDKNKLRVLELPDRVCSGSLPSVEVVDLRREEGEPGEHGQRYFSRRVRQCLDEVLDNGEQAIILVNRRGWAPVLLCRECGLQAPCRDCSIPMTVHRRRGALMCHYCGLSQSIPTACPRCNGLVLDHIGAGTEKIAARVRELFPKASVAILDRDTARSPAELIATLQNFALGHSNVLVGTQMVSKGHHFPQVTLTVVVNADNLLGFPDFRGAERTFQMLTQVAGRAGRGDRPGRVVIQTYHPDHHAVRAAAGHDVKRFADEELRYRRAFRYPPGTRLALIRFESESERAAMDTADAAARALAGEPASVRRLGPSLAPLARLRGRWRVQILLLAPTRPILRAALAKVAGLDVPRSVRRIIDVDPQSTT